MKKFLELYKVGLAEAEEIDDYLEDWHNSPDDGVSVFDYLGMTWDEYGEWVMHDILPPRYLAE